MYQIKLQIYNSIIQLLDKKIDSAKTAIEMAKESRDSDTKSSAGDKYETGRAMMQMELEKNEAQRSKNFTLKNELSKIDIEKENTKVEFGSLVITDLGKYFISIGIGKIEIDNDSYYAISLASPVGKQLKDKKTGDSFHFQGKEMVIKGIF